MAMTAMSMAMCKQLPGVLTFTLAGLMKVLTAACHVCSYMPGVFRAISPHYAFQYFCSTGEASWVSLNGILLCVSGSEALFADMGHFSHRAISVSALPEDALKFCDLVCMVSPYEAEM